MAGKPIRLGKAAGELNVGLPTIVEFLVTKGIKIMEKGFSHNTQSEKVKGHGSGRPLIYIQFAHNHCPVYELCCE